MKWDKRIQIPNEEKTVKIWPLNKLRNIFFRSNNYFAHKRVASERPDARHKARASPHASSKRKGELIIDFFSYFPSVYLSQ